jgi:molybdenum cofactor biosynthesis protein B
MGEPSTELHRRAAADRGPIPISIVTVSDTRTPADDVNGQYLRDRIAAIGHKVEGYRVIPDEPSLVLQALEELAPVSRVILFNGGTGISRRDTTYDALSGRLEKVLPGFGEIFRMLSWDQVGPAAMLSRATAGICGKTLVFSVPGSPAAVRLAWERLLEPELEHLVWEVLR